MKSIKNVLVITEDLLTGKGISESFKQMFGNGLTVSIIKNAIEWQGPFNVVLISASKALKNLTDIAKRKKQYGKDTKTIIFSVSDKNLEDAEKLGLADLYLETFFLVGEFDSETKEKILSLLN